MSRNEKELFDELLLRMTRSALQGGAATQHLESSECTISSVEVYKALETYFREASQRTKRSESMAISEEDLCQILSFTMEELYTSHMTTPPPSGAEPFQFQSAKDFISRSPLISIRALRSGLQRRSGVGKGSFPLASSFTEVVELCRAVDTRRGVAQPMMGAVRLTTFAAVAVTLRPVVRLRELLEAISDVLSCNVYVEDPLQRAVALGLLSAVLTNWAALDTDKAPQLIRLSAAVMAALPSETPTSPADVVREALRDPEWALLAQSYPDPVMAADGEGRRRGATRAQPSAPPRVNAEWGSSSSLPSSAHPASSAANEEEGEVEDTVDYSFWSAIASQPQGAASGIL